jgi:PTH1 family peptidyl-tRNA hydrolase
MKLVVGLGNPGEKYVYSRHNLGFTVVETLLQALTPVEKTAWRREKKTRSLVVKFDVLLLAKPQTLMNASGFAVKRLADFYQIDPAEIWVVHDDLDLPLGKIRIRRGGGTAGHRGVDSVAKELGTHGFVRFRLGIGRPVKGGKQLAAEAPEEKKVEEYVLMPFASAEKSQVRRMVRQAVAAVNLALKEGLEAAMARFNP